MPHPPLDDLAVLGDGRSVALVSSDGVVTWWAAPRLDTDPLITQVIAPDEASGFRLAARDVVRTERVYVEDTNVLRTTVTTRTGVAAVTESLNSGAAGRLPWTELARRIDGVQGEVTFDWKFVAGTGLRSWSPWTEQVGHYVVLHAGSLLVGFVVSDGVEVSREHQAVRGTTTVAAGQRRLVAAVVTDGEPVFFPSWLDVDDRLDISVEAWSRWSAQISTRGPHRAAVVRSALALKTLVMSGTGAIAAAPTTSLPERVGGDKNWDYRYAWVRDASLTVDALLACGIREEVHAAVSWLLAAVRASGLRVLYTLDGTESPGERDIDVGGFGGSVPVRVGNRAGAQLQLGIFGDLFGTVTSWVDDGHVLDVGSRRQLADLADRCADEWRQTDAGIWELEEDRHYTSSKIACWRALRCASILSERGLIAGRGDRWAAEAELVRTFVEDRCWSPSRHAYLMSADDDRLDSSLLLATRFEFDRGDRMRSTITALRRELDAGDGLLYRYTGVDDEEECFLASSYWLVEALAEVGRLDDAGALLRVLDATAPGPLGLMAEMRTPGGGPMVGNFPQALSHLAHINAVHSILDRTEGRSG